METFAQILQKLMDADGVTQTELATAAGLSQPGISKLVSGEQKHPRKDTVLKLMAAFGASHAQQALRLLAAAGYERDAVRRPSVVALIGGSGAGKTTIANQIKDLAPQSVALISSDDFYRTRIDVETRNLTYGFDHPESINQKKLYACLDALRRYQPADVPVYDMGTDSITGSRTVEPAAIVVAEGHLGMTAEETRALVDVIVWIEADDDTRLIRRMERDEVERKRDLKSVVQQWVSSVRPAHQLHVEPLRKFAHLIIPNEHNDRKSVPLAVKMLLTWLSQLPHALPVLVDQERLLLSSQATVGSSFAGSAQT